MDESYISTILVAYRLKNTYAIPSFGPGSDARGERNALYNAKMHQHTIRDKTNPAGVYTVEANEGEAFADKVILYSSIWWQEWR